MYRLLIVDDEEIIVNGLYEIFTGMKNLDLDVYKAYSGEEAIQWLNRTRIDIVLTDIRMPEIDGLELLDIINKKWPQCKVIFLTGYSEFDYVYKAIQHKGVNYILKNEDYDKVIDAVKDAIKDIQNEINTEDLINKAKEQMSMASEMFQDYYFIHMLHDDPSINISQLQFEQLETPLNYNKPVILLLGHVDNSPENLSYVERMQYLYSIRLIIKQYLDKNVLNVYIMDENYSFVLFIQPMSLEEDKKDKQRLTNVYEKTVLFLKWTLETIQSSCKESLDATISFVLSGEPCRWAEVSKKYYSLNKLLNYRIGTGIEMLLVDNEIKKDIICTNSETTAPDIESEALELQLRQKKLDKIELYLELGQKDKYFEALSMLISPLRAIKNINSNVAIEAYYKVSLSILSYINRYKLLEKKEFYIDQGRLVRVDNFKSWQDAVEYIYEISNDIFRIQSEEQQKRADNAIHYVQKFIEEHLNEDLSLVRLAEQVYLNPSYLSRLYKQVRGINISEFIDNSRINRAKELLEKENVKINCIAKMVGYETAASFTRFFRKIVGCSPQEYHETFLLNKYK